MEWNPAEALAEEDEKANKFDMTISQM